MRTIVGGVLGKIPRPTPAMAVALLALLIACSGAAVAAGSFTASDGTITACRDNKTAVLRVIQSGQSCNTSKETTITWKDGINGTVAASDNSDKLDNKDSTEFLGANQTAADSDKLDGQDSTAFAPASHEHSTQIEYFGGEVNNLVASPLEWKFVGDTASVTLPSSSQRITGSGVASLGMSSGGPSELLHALCRRPTFSLTNPVVPFANDHFSRAQVTTTRTPFAVSDITSGVGVEPARGFSTM